MESPRPRQIFTGIIALVWIINGLFCKVLHLVPRHGQIVSEILGSEHAAVLTVIIGILELLMAAWILSGIAGKLCAVTQILLVGMMNVLEILLVPDLLLFGPYNGIFALAFMVFIGYTAFPGKKDRLYNARI